MKKQLINLGLIFVIAFSLTVPVLAQEAETTEATTTEQTEPAPAQTIEERQAERKERLISALTEKEAERLAKRCKAAQAVITKSSERYGGVYENRVNVYNQLTAKLESLSGRIAAQDVDTAALDAAIQETQRLIDEFMVLMEEQKIAIADSLELDCQADPSGFKVALEDAREQRREVMEAAIAIKKQVKENVKTELQNIKAILEAKDNSADDTQEPAADPTSSDAQDPDTPVTNEETN